MNSLTRFQNHNSWVRETSGLPLLIFSVFDVQTKRYIKSIKQPRKDCQCAQFVREFITNVLASIDYQHQRQKMAQVKDK